MQVTRANSRIPLPVNWESLTVEQKEEYLLQYDPDYNPLNPYWIPPNQRYRVEGEVLTVYVADDPANPEVDGSTADGPASPEARIPNQSSAA